MQQSQPIRRHARQRFAKEIVRDHATLRREQRHADRQRRANNPDCYDTQGRAIKTKHPRNKSRRQRHTQARIRDLHRKEAAHRKTLHGQFTEENDWILRAQVAGNPKTPADILDILKRDPDWMVRIAVLSH